jgi:hypothetical protein
MTLKEKGKEKGKGKEKKVGVRQTKKTHAL